MSDDDKKGTLIDVFYKAGQYIDSFWLDKGQILTQYLDQD